MYLKPPAMLNSDNATRRVGIELEFAGISPDTVASVLAKPLSGEVEKVSEAEYIVSTQKNGDFLVELDWGFAKALAKRRVDQNLTDEADTDNVMKWMTQIASTLVPVEVVCPPIAIDRLTILDEVVDALHENGAVGTQDSVFYAFGLHINPELPDLKVATIIRYLKAYIVAKDWLIAKHNIDASRRITPYINQFPTQYEELVINYAENVNLDEFIDHYIEFNPTRNRAFDLLPLLKHLSAEKILSAFSEDEKINQRPTFHYRLPNCEIENKDWLISTSWNIWCVIEELAHNIEALSPLIEQFRSYKPAPLGLDQIPWHQTLDQLHESLLSV